MPVIASSAEGCRFTWLPTCAPSIQISPFMRRMMAQLQPVLGFFDTIEEAQQAVQLLLARGFTDKNVKLSTRTTPATTGTGESLPPPTESDSSSGRFFSALFASRTESRSRNGILVTVQTQSTAEVRQVADLLDTAGAGDVAVDERLNSRPW